MFFSVFMHGSTSSCVCVFVCVLLELVFSFHNIGHGAKVQVIRLALSAFVCSAIFLDQTQVMFNTQDK